MPTHRHCEVCGTSMATDGRVCSAECQTKWVQAVRMRKRNLYVVMAAVLVMAFLGFYGNRFLGHP